MLKIKSKLALCLGVLLLVIGNVVVLSNKSQISNCVVTRPDGLKKTIEIPFESTSDGVNDVYVYDLTLTNPLFFSGKLHIIPDDCLLSFTVNGVNIPCSEFSEGQCDCLNGFYLDLSNYLQKGDNRLHLEIENTHGFYGVNILDVTFYEKYSIILALFFALAFIDLKQVFLCGLNYFKQNRVLTKLLLCLSGLLILTVLMVNFIDELPYSEWVVSGFMLMLVLIPVLYSIFKHFSYGKETSFLFLTAVLIWILYAVKLHYSFFSYDTEGHLAYVQYLFRTGQAPISSGGWSFYHPSLYYRFISVFWKMVNFGGGFGEAALMKLAQMFSLVLFILYGYFSLKTVDLFFRCLRGPINIKFVSIAYFSSVALFLFWPSNAVFSVRFGNDILFNFFYALSFYFISSWWFSRSLLHFVLALIFVSLGVWSKTNAFILMGVIGVLLIGRYLLEKEKKRFEYFNKLFILVGFSMVTLYFSFHEKLGKSNQDTRFVVGNANGLGDGFDVGVGLYNYLVLNPVDFVQIPFTSSLEEGKGREFFWFYLLKSSMFGEFSYSAPASILLAKVLSFIQLLLLLLILFGFFFALKRKFMMPIIVDISVLLVSMMIFRYFYPYSCSNDFRYIFPAVLPMAILGGSSLLFLTRYRLFYNVAFLVVVGFVIFSVVFQVSYLVMN